MNDTRCFISHSLDTKGFEERNQRFTLTFLLSVFTLPLEFSWNNQCSSFYESVHLCK